MLLLFSTIQDDFMKLFLNSESEVPNAEEIWFKHAADVHSFFNISTPTKKKNEE
jgi:hypothetical protein